MWNESLAAWGEPLPADERAALIERVAKAVVDRGLQSAAVLALEMHKPLAFVAAQTMIVTTPLLAPLIGLDRMQRVGRLLQEPGAVEAVIVRIEEMTVERDHRPLIDAREVA